MIKYLFVTVFMLLVSLRAMSDDECLRWMLKGRVLPGTKDCELDCSTIAVDMSTFMCPSQCPDLCKIYLPRYIENKITFPKSMTDADKALVRKYPLDAISVREAMIKVQKATENKFGDSARNDESDAFRHYVWAGLLTKSLGENKARLFLEAHEKRPSQPKEEFEMDTYNNNAGVESAKKLIKKGKFSQENLEKAAIKAIKSGKLKVIDKFGLPPGV